MQKQSEERKLRPKQKQRRPGKRSEIRSVPHAEPVKQENKLGGKVTGFGSEPPLGRAGEPNEVATYFLFLVSGDSSYMNGQCLHLTTNKVTI